METLQFNKDVTRLSLGSISATVTLPQESARGCTAPQAQCTQRGLLAGFYSMLLILHSVCKTSHCQLLV